MKYRENTYDINIIKEVTRVYKNLDMTNNCVLDIGANIGAFTLFAIEKGASRVIGFEPEPDNFALCYENCKIFTNTQIINKAIVCNDDLTRQFFLNKGINKGAHSLYVHRGRDIITINCIKFETVLNQYQPKIIKMDIEGGEYELLPQYILPNYVMQLAVEYHFKKNTGKN